MSLAGLDFARCARLSYHVKHASNSFQKPGGVHSRLIVLLPPAGYKSLVITEYGRLAEFVSAAWELASVDADPLQFHVSFKSQCRRVKHAGSAPATMGLPAFWGSLSGSFGMGFGFMQGLGTCCDGSSQSKLILNSGLLDLVDSQRYCGCVSWLMALAVWLLKPPGRCLGSLESFSIWKFWFRLPTCAEFWGLG